MYIYGIIWIRGTSTTSFIIFLGFYLSSKNTDEKNYPDFESYLITVEDMSAIASWIQFPNNNFFLMNFTKSSTFLHYT